MKFAVVILYELRAIKKTIENYYKYLIDFYNADVFIICQNTFDDDYENLKLFNRNVKYIMLYEKPDPKKYFGENSNINLPMGAGNWNNHGNLQIYINNNEASKVLKDYVDQYDYFIQLRLDIDILFDFPKSDLFEKIPHGIYGFHPNYCSGWGGSGAGNFIHKDFLIDYLNSYYELMTNNNYKEYIMYRISLGILNQEMILNIALEIKKFKMIPITNINYYYTTEKLNSYTTWSKPSYNTKYDVICKYPEQCNEAFDALTLWNNNKKWVFIDNQIKLL